MEDKHIQKIWKAGSASEQTGEVKVLKELDGTIRKLEGGIKRRDRLEIIIALLAIPIFIYIFFINENSLTKLGSLIMIAYCLLVIYQLRNVKKHRKPFDPLSTIKNQLINMRHYLSKEKSLLDSVLYWYLLPPFIGIFLITIGNGNPIASISIQMSVIAILYYYIYRLNKKAVRNRFNPLIQDLDLAIQELNMPAED